ncbi:MAG: hypothetical protein IJ775_00920 [Muribaculaceae bacterium]|nr:hypothetical protein [Muribaculaceae bacterium]
MKNLFIRFALCFALVMVAASSFADNRLYVKDFAINPGETKIAEIYLESDMSIISLQADIKLPEGLTIDCDEVTLTDRAKRHSIMAHEKDGVYTIMSFSMNNAAYKGTDGAIIEIPVTASNEFKQSGTIYMSDILLQASDRSVPVSHGNSESQVFIATIPVE